MLKPLINFTKTQLGIFTEELNTLNLQNMYKDKITYFTKILEVERK